MTPTERNWLWIERLWKVEAVLLAVLLVLVAALVVKSA